MARPVMKRRERVRVEFSLTPELAARIYDYADAQSLTLSQTGSVFLPGHCLTKQIPVPRSALARTRRHRQTGRRRGRFTTTAIKGRTPE